MIAYDPLRPPSVFDPSAAAYKEWLHLNLFDHGNAVVGVVNVSLHGDPRSPQALSVLAVLIHRTGHGWVGGAEVHGPDETRMGTSMITVPDGAFAVDHAAGAVFADARLTDLGVSVRLEARAVGPSRAIERPVPIGDGWLSWYVVPRLTVTGHVQVGDERHALANATAYHDHNWGRWHWGDDVAWDWATFHATQDDLTVVFARSCDRARTRLGRAWLLVRSSEGERRFPASSVEVESDAWVAGRAHRIPGAMAALHQDRSRPLMPTRFRLAARHAGDRVELEFAAESVGQIINADPVKRGYGFIHELAGRFTARGVLSDRAFEVDGLGIVERVD